MAVLTAQSPLANSRAVLESEQPLRIVVLGDSVAAGCSASSYSLAFPALFAGALRDDHSVPVKLINLAVAGLTSADALPDAEDVARAYLPDLAIIAFGLNDQRAKQKHLFEKPGPRVPAFRFRENMARVADRLRRRGGTDVVFVTPFPHPGGDDYRDVLLEFAARSNFAVADVPPLWPEDDADYLDADRLHPNDKGHQVYAEALTRLGL